MIGTHSVNMAGKVCGRLRVVKPAFIKQYPSTKVAYWHCQCECGNEKNVDGRNLRNGTTQSCGCLGKENKFNSKRLKGIPFTAEHKRKISDALKGKTRSEEHSHKISESKIGLYKGKGNPNWRGGISFLPYSSLFSRQLKERVRVRDNFTCQLCGVPELECNERLSIHHIDYDKTNCDISNLVTLCRSCNSKANSNREYWNEYFKNAMEVQNHRLIFS